jgi:hypothetical protein
VDRVEDEPVWLRSPDFGDVFVGWETAEGLKPTGEVISGDEVVEMGPQLVVAIRLGNVAAWRVLNP